MSSIYEDRATVRIRVYLGKDQRIGRIDGPPTEGENGSRVLRARPDMNGEFKLTGCYDLTGIYIPFFPPDLDGQCGIEDWLKKLDRLGFTIVKVEGD